MKKRQEFRRLLHVMRPGFFSTFGSNGRLRWWDPHAIVSLSARGSQREPRNAFLFVWLGFWVSRSEGKKKGSKGRRRAPLKRRQTPKLGKPATIESTVALIWKKTTWNVISCFLLYFFHLWRQMTFKRPATDRNLSFAEIAETTGVRAEEVELLVMKALAQGLLKGTIDQVDSVVHFTWVQPRVLDKKQVRPQLQPSWRYRCWRRFRFLWRSCRRWCCVWRTGARTSARWRVWSRPRRTTSSPCNSPTPVCFLFVPNFFSAPIQYNILRKSDAASLPLWKRSRAVLRAGYPSRTPRGGGSRDPLD